MPQGHCRFLGLYPVRREKVWMAGALRLSACCAIPSPCFQDERQRGMGSGWLGVCPWRDGQVTSVSAWGISTWLSLYGVKLPLRKPRGTMASSPSVPQVGMKSSGARQQSPQHLALVGMESLRPRFNRCLCCAVVCKYKMARRHIQPAAELCPLRLG